MDLKLSKFLLTKQRPQGLTRVKVHRIGLYSSMTRTHVISSILQTGTSIRACPAVTAQGLSNSWGKADCEKQVCKFEKKKKSHRVTHSSTDYTDHTHLTDRRLLCSLEGIHRFHWCPHRRPRSGKDILLQTHTDGKFAWAWQQPALLSLGFTTRLPVRYWFEKTLSTAYVGCLSYTILQNQISQTCTSWVSINKTKKHFTS